nr:cytochrome b/b6 domain-containing protein [Caldimonas sp.]
MTERARDDRVLVWGAALRLLHWTLAALVVFDFVVDDGGPLHRGIGYVAAGVVALRLLHAAWARGEESLRALKPSFARTLAYLRRGTPRTIGHDPLGVWMVWLLWTLVLLLGVTGWMTRLDAFWGDDRLHAVHAVLADALLVAAVLHVAGVAAMSWRWRENLPAAMVTGEKRR